MEAVGWSDTNWLSNGPLGEWHGVSTDADGRVAELDLDGKQLSGPIPSELGNLTNLERLSLWGNQLSGPIPSELGNLANLQALSLRDNQLSGPIPSELGNLDNLERLWLRDNQLSGPIPSELGNLDNLQWLSLYDNQLTPIHRRYECRGVLKGLRKCSCASGIMAFETGNRPETRSTQQMLPLDHPDRIQITFDDRRLVANAGLLLPVTLAQHLGLRELVDHHLDLGNAPGRANPGDKMLTLVASALAGGDCIDDADVLRTGGTAQTLGCVVKAPSTLGTFLRSFRWGHVRQLDRVSRELLARAWSAGAGPGDAPFTIDLDSTICETYGLAKEGARDHGYTGKRGYHPLLAVAAGTGDVLMARLREGRANTARGAAHFLRETVGRVRLRRGQGTTHGAGRQRLLHPRHRRRLPPDGCPLLHHHPPEC